MGMWYWFKNYLPENLRRSFGLWERHEAMSILIGLLISGLLATLSALGIYIAIPSFTLLSYLGLGLLSWFLWLVLVVTPVKMWRSERERADNLEENMKPCLEIMESPTRQGDGAFGDGHGWGLMIRNTGSKVAESCRGYLEQITFETHASKVLDSFPRRSFHWSEQPEGATDFTVLGGQIARFHIVYFDYKYGSLSNVITLAYRANKDFRLHYELSAFTEPLLLLFSITSKGKSPQYVVCRVDLNALAEDLVDLGYKPPCKILWKGTERKELSEFTKVKEEVEDGD